MALIDMQSKKVLVSHTLEFEQSDLGSQDESQIVQSKHLSTLELFKIYLIFQIEAKSVKVLNLLTLKENTLAGTENIEYSSLIFIEKQNKILALRDFNKCSKKGGKSGECQIWDLNTLNVTLIDNDIINPTKIERFHPFQYFQPYTIFEDQKFMLIYRPESLPNKENSFLHKRESIINKENMCPKISKMIEKKRLQKKQKKQLEQPKPRNGIRDLVVSTERYDSLLGHFVLFNIE